MKMSIMRNMKAELFKFRIRHLRHCKSNFERALDINHRLLQIQLAIRESKNGHNEQAEVDGGIRSDIR
jgi:hypothetical protein